MILFPIIAVLLALALVSLVALLAGEAVREHSIHPQHRPVLRAIALVTLIELVVVTAWILVVGQR